VNKGENPASRISFSHAGENHVHAVNKGENPASRTLYSFGLRGPLFPQPSPSLRDVYPRG